MSIAKPPARSRNWLTLSNIITGLMVVLLAAMIIFPDVKATFIRGLMKVGLFQPDIPQTKGPREGKTIDNSDIVLYDKHRRQVDMDSLKGKIVFINFWTTWCPPCLAEMPSINLLYSKFRKDTAVVFLMVDMDDAPVRSQAFLDKNEYELPLFVPGAAVPSRLFTGTLPTTVILDRSGNITMKHEGAADYGSLRFEQFIRSLK